jgi:glycosyltransferase involved in cell wall biosynthesis
MRIAVLSYGLPVVGSKRGGIERSAHVIAQGLAERGHHVTVFSHDPAPEHAAYEVRELPWKTFVNTWIGRRVTMGYFGNVLALLPDYRACDAILAHGDSLLLPLAGKPVVRVMHGTAWEEATSATSLGRFVLQCGVYAQELLSAAVNHNTVAVSYNTRRRNPFVRHTIPHGVDASVFHPLPREKSATPSILFVGTLAGRKRGAFLLDVFQRDIGPRYPDCSLMFVGPPGPQLPGVTYYTGVADEQLSSLYRRAWVFASPSTYEGFGLPYLEAMASGTAVVATPNPGSREVLADGRYGRLVDDRAFGAALLDLLAHEDVRRAAEVVGIERAQEFRADAMIDRYEALLMELCGQDAKSVASA